MFEQDPLYKNRYDMFLEYYLLDPEAPLVLKRESSTDKTLDLELIPGGSSVKVTHENKE